MDAVSVINTVCSSRFENGYQIEKPDDWLKYGNPFEIKRPEYAVEVKFGDLCIDQKDEETGRNKVCSGKLSVSFGCTL